MANNSWGGWPPKESIHRAVPGVEDGLGAAAGGDHGDVTEIGRAGRPHTRCGGRSKVSGRDRQPGGVAKTTRWLQVM